MKSDVGLDASAGQIAQHDIVAEQHLGSDAAGRPAFGPVEGRQDSRLAGVQQRLQSWTDIVLETEDRPLDALQVHLAARPTEPPGPGPSSDRR